MATENLSLSNSARANESEVVPVGDDGTDMNPGQKRSKRTQFEDDNAAMAYIVTSLGEHLPRGLAVAIGEQYVVRCCIEGEIDDWPNLAPEDGEVSIGTPFFGPWTVREEELHDLKEVALGLIGAAARPREAVVSLALSAACMLWRLRRNGVSVNPLQRAVLITLRRTGPLSLEALVLKTCGSWTRADVEEAVRELGAVRLTNGKVVPLVHADRDGRLSTDARGLWEVPFGASG